MINFNLKSLPPIFELLGKGLAFITIILMTRILTIDEMSIYSLVLTVVMILSVFMDGGVTNKAYALLLQNNKEDIAELFTIKLLLSFVCIVVLFIYSFIRFDYWQSVIIYALITFLISMIAFYKMTYRVRGVVKRDIVCVLVDPITKATILVTIYLFELNISLENLLLIFLFASILEYWFIRFVFNREDNFIYFEKLSIHAFLKKLKSLKHFVLYYFLYILSQRIDIFYIEEHLNSTDVAIYFSAFNIYAALIMFVASLGSSIFPDVKEKSILRITYHLKGWFVLYSILACLSVYLIPLIYPYIYPIEYESGANVLNYLIFSLPFVLVNYLLILMNNFKDRSVINVVSLMFTVVLRLFILYVLGDGFTSLQDYAILYMLIEAVTTITLIILMLLKPRSLNRKKLFNVN